MACIIFSVSTLSYAITKDEEAVLTKHQLEKINKDINKLQDELGKDKSFQKKEQSSLKSAEKELILLIEEFPSEYDFQFALAEFYLYIKEDQSYIGTVHFKNILHNMGFHAMSKKEIGMSISLIHRWGTQETQHRPK